MTKLFPLLVAATLIAPGSAYSKDRLAPEAQLAKALEGRVAGKAVDCISLSRSQASTVIPGRAIIYRDGSTLYLNTPRAGAESLTDWDVLVTKTFSSRLCSSDTVRLVDRSTRATRGVVFLGEFVPYRRMKDNSTN